MQETINQLNALVQIIFVDLVFAGDNAIIIAMVAASFSPSYRRKVIFYGIGIAVVLRIIFALIAIQLLNINGVSLLGGLLLFWVCWSLWKSIRGEQSSISCGEDGSNTGPTKKEPSLAKAILQIVLADVSMSLDNVLAVAGIARHHPQMMVFGLVLSITFMAVAATLISRLLKKHRWIGYIGLVIIFYVAIQMIIIGIKQLTGTT